MAYQIRTYGDPVLKTKAAEVADINGKIARLVDDMFDTLYDSDSGIALAAPQIGVQKQIFVWDVDDEQMAIINPQIVESSGEWVYDEGCLSIPGLYVEMLRPNHVLIRGFTVDGDEIEIEAERADGSHVPARDRPPPRRADVRPDDARAAQGSDAGVPPAARAARGRSTEASPATAVTRAAPPRRLVYLGTPRRWRCRRCGRSWPPASRSRWS